MLFNISKLVGDFLYRVLLTQVGCLAHG
jgi:hypothetical protein